MLKVQTPVFRATSEQVNCLLKKKEESSMEPIYNNISELKKQA